MTFKTTTTKKEQIDYIKKYAFFLIPKGYRIYVIFFLLCLIYHFY